jgi:cytochrome c
MAAVVATLMSTAGGAATPKFGFGQPATAAEIAAWDIDVRPDGTGLPPGRGSVSAGQAIYDAKCVSCHGTFGESNAYLQIAGGVGSLGKDPPLRTTGSKLNYATTLWDYINRAMPFEAPKTLSPDEVYALTAYVLNLNDIVPADAVLDQTSLPLVEMPNRHGMTTEHGFMVRDGKSDTHNVACMKNCVKQVRVASELPDYARDQHGEIALQSRMFSASPAAPVSLSGLDVARASACTACHGMSEKIVGPSFRDIAQRYAGDSAAARNLVIKVRNGGSGNWGTVPMPAQPQLDDADARALVAWILAGAR